VQNATPTSTFSSKQTPRTVYVSPSGKPPSENNSKSPSIHILTWSHKTVQTNKSSTTDSKKEKQPNGQHAAKLKQTLGFFFSARTMTPQKTIADRELIFSTLCAIAPTSTNLWQDIQRLLVKDSQLSVVITTSSTPKKWLTLRLTHTATGYTEIQELVSQLYAENSPSEA